MKKHSFGMALAVISFTVVYMMVSRAKQMLTPILNKIESGEIPADMDVVKDFIIKSQTPGEVYFNNILTLIFLIAWIVGVVGSYRIARSQEKNTTLEA